MPTEKKLLAAAAFTRSQADFFTAQVENARLGVLRAQDAVRAAEDSLHRAIAKAEQKELEAREAEDAASGIPVFVEARPAQFGVNS